MASRQAILWKFWLEEGNTTNLWYSFQKGECFAIDRWPNSMAAVFVPSSSCLMKFVLQFLFSLFMNSVKLVIPLRFISYKNTPNDAVTPQRQSQFTPKMKANAVPRLLSLCCELTGTMNVTEWPVSWNSCCAGCVWGPEMLLQLYKGSEGGEGGEGEKGL